MSTPEDWTPGDPIHPWDSRPHRNVGLYNFRRDTEAAECTCSDAARWPNPRGQYTLYDDVDEIGRFIEAHRMWRANQEGVA